ncbi:MAG TPA: serine hydrolase domain-containing protein [Terriglobia bacterium]|nr:serine hydrolase domain-containing protein [Terriglobia bacterium]
MIRTRHQSGRAPYILFLLLLIGESGVGLAASVAASRPEARPEGESFSNPKEVQAFFDRFFASEMPRWHIPGAAIELVKDGQVVFSKGYGYADLERQIPVNPQQTVFRVGSVSKVFTATAVLQLVQRGKLNLNANVDQYLTNLKLHNPYPQPVTLAELLTHSAGLDASVVGIAAKIPAQVTPMGEFLARKMPPVVMPPGKIYSYSSFGVTLEGYLVQKLSGEPFDEYMDKHILLPLNMRDSSFQLTPQLAAHLATGYDYHRGRYAPQPIDYFNIAPAAGLYSTAADMAHFLIAQLQDGQYDGSRILSECSAREMHRRQFTDDPRLAGRTFGFYERFVNGRRAIGHGGNIRGFASLLMLAPKEHVGFFLAFNRDESRFEDSLINSFFDRFYPEVGGEAPPDPVRLSTSELRKVIGSYRSNPYSRRTFEKLITLYWQFRITANADGSLEFHYPHDYKPSARWTPLAPDYFLCSGGQGHAVFDRDSGGNVVHLFTDRDSFEKLPWYGVASFQVALVKALMLILVSGCFWWPLHALIRRLRSRRSGQKFAWGRARWCAAALGVLNVIFIIEMLHLLTRMDDWNFVYGVPTVIKALLWIPIFSTVLAGIVLYLAVRAWSGKSGSLWDRVHYGLISAAGLAFVWFFLYWNLLGFRY